MPSGRPSSRCSLQPRIPPQRSGGDGRLPDRRDALQTMFSGTKNSYTGCTLLLRHEAAFCAAPRKARSAGRGSDEAAQNRSK